MAGIAIPALGRKLRLLIDRGLFEDWQTLALTFQRSASTIQWWGHGDQARAANTLPADQYDNFLALIERCFPHIRNQAEAKDFAIAPITEWEVRLNAPIAPSINSIIETEAGDVSVVLFLKPELETGLIETDKTAPKAQPQIALELGKWFRLEIKVPNGHGYFSVLQHAANQWGVVPAYWDKTEGIILLPGLKADGQHSFMIERQALGLHRFIVMQTPEPCIDYLQHLDQGLALDSLAMSRIAHFFSEQPMSRRKIYVASLEMITPSD